MKYDIAQHTLVGARPDNQDRIATAERDNAVLLVVADGLGGHAGGAMAAETLVQIITKDFQRVRQPIIHEPSAFLALSILHAHKMINNYARSTYNDLTARSTCVACLVQNGYAYWAHVGDSRLYHIRGGRLLSRTVDHSTTEQLEQDGIYDSADLHNHKVKNYLLKCVGGPHKPRVSLGAETRLMQGDILLLCTDGVWNAYTTDELLSALQKYNSLDESVEELLLNGEVRMKEACDNLSAVALRWDDAITTHAPLQSGESAAELDQDMLWQSAKHQNKLRKLARRHGVLDDDTGGAADGADAIEDDETPSTRQTIASEIEELEAFINSLEKQG